MLFTPSGHGNPCPDIYSRLPRGKQALTRTRQTESVSWTRTSTRTNRRSCKPESGLRRWETQPLLPLASSLGITKTSHSRGELRPGQTVQFHAAPMAPAGLTPKHPHPAEAARGISKSLSLPGGCFASWSESSLLCEGGPTCYVVGERRGQRSCDGWGWGDPETLDAWPAAIWPRDANCHAAAQGVGVGP